MAKFKKGDKVRIEGCGSLSGRTGRLVKVRKDFLGEDIAVVTMDNNGMEEEVPLDCVGLNAVACNIQSTYIVTYKDGKKIPYESYGGKHLKEKARGYGDCQIALHGDIVKVEDEYGKDFTRDIKNACGVVSKNAVVNAALNATACNGKFKHGDKVKFVDGLYKGAKATIDDVLSPRKIYATVEHGGEHLLVECQEDDLVLANAVATNNVVAKNGISDDKNTLMAYRLCQDALSKLDKARAYIGMAENDDYAPLEAKAIDMAVGQVKHAMAKMR